MAQLNKRGSMTDNDTIYSLLKVNGKGWDIRLFENENKVSECLCSYCNSVCLDAVELGCDHDDNDLFLFCNDCLKQLIKEKHNKCPINGHYNPSIISSRFVRKQISKSIVMCPYSIQYKTECNYNQQHNDENIMDIIDTGDYIIDNEENEGNQQMDDIAIYQEQVYGNKQFKIQMNINKNREKKQYGDTIRFDEEDEKEGNEALNHNETEINEYEQESDNIFDKNTGCDWNGTLYELINEHLIECINKNNPSFTLNTKIKDLEIENKALNKKIISLGNIINNQQNKIDRYENIIDKLQNVIIQLSEQFVIDETDGDVADNKIDENEKQNQYEFIIPIQCRKRLKKINKKQLKYKGEYFSVQFYWSQFGPLLTGNDNITIHIEMEAIGNKLNYGFGFASDQFIDFTNGDPYNAATILANGTYSIKNEFDSINDSKVIQSMCQRINLFDNQTDGGYITGRGKYIVVISVNMKQKRGWIYNYYDKLNKVIFNLPNKVSIIVMLSGSEDKLLTVKKIIV